MNKDNLIPISYVKQFTPLVVGDRFFNVVIDEEFKIEEEGHAKSLNENSFNFFNNIFLVSFANRPNTGTQPVGDDVSTNALFDGEWIYGSRACIYGWHLDEGITKWKPNHAAMLKQFKEQGANTVTKLAEQKRLAHAVALTIEALDDYPSETVPVAESMIGSSEFYQTGGNPQIIEPWVGDQLSDLINPVSEGCQADKPKLVMTEKARGSSYDRFVAVGWSDDLLIKHGFAKVDKPVFTQAMEKAGETAPVGSVCVVTMKPNGISHTGTLKYLSEAYIIMEINGFDQHFHAASWFVKPIDNRTEGQKIRDNLSVLVSGYVSAGEECDIQHYVDELMQSFSITLNKE